MKKIKLHHKIFAIVLVIAITFQSMPELNSHTYTTGFNNFHMDYFFLCFPTGNIGHFSYECGQPFHIF